MGPGDGDPLTDLSVSMKKNTAKCLQMTAHTNHHPHPQTLTLTINALTPTIPPSTLCYSPPHHHHHHHHYHHHHHHHYHQVFLKKTLKVPFSQSGPSCRAVLMSGPPGIGKTTTATLVARSLGYEVFVSFTTPSVTNILTYDRYLFFHYITTVTMASRSLGYEVLILDLLAFKPCPVPTSCFCCVICYLTRNVCTPEYIHTLTMTTTLSTLV